MQDILVCDTICHQMTNELTLPLFISNLSINSFCPLDTALVLTSDNFHLIFPPSPHPFLSRNPLVAFLKNSHVVPSLPCVHIHLLSTDLERHLDCRNYQIRLCVFFLRRYFFLVRVLPFFSHFFVCAFISLF